jgi:epoxyqueuosine reductase
MDPSGKRLLLHICCAPDATVGVEEYAGKCAVEGYFYNPNIEAGGEYRRRLDAMRKLGEATDFPWREEPPDFSAWEEAVRGLETEPERTGRRCEVCTRMRLRRAAETARREGFDLVGTVLTVSRLKDEALVNRVGAQEAARAGVRWLFADLKKRDGFGRSVAWCRQYDIWRQDYCGCRFSRKKSTSADR